MTFKHQKLLCFTLSFCGLLVVASFAFSSISNSTNPARAALVWGGMGLFAALTIALKALFK